MTELDIAEEGFYARVKGDLDLVDLIGTDEAGIVRVYPGPPTDTEQASDYSRVTYLAIDDPVTGAVSKVRIQVDIFVWSQATTAFDPDQHLGAIDEKLVALFDRQWWMHGGRRLSSHRLGGARTWPTDPRRPLRRTREFEILIS